MLLMFTSDGVRCHCLNLLSLSPCAVQEDFINMTWATFSPTHFLSHDIMGWYWQAPTSCFMLWDFTGNQRRQNTQAALMVAPYISKSKQLHFHHKSPNGANICEISQLMSDYHVDCYDLRITISTVNSHLGINQLIKSVSSIKACSVLMVETSSVHI